MAFASIGPPWTRKAPELPILPVDSPAPAGSWHFWWNGLSGFWRAQIVGWGLFTVVDFVNQRLLEHVVPIALSRTAVVITCLVLISWGLRAVYASPRFDNRLSASAAAWVVLLCIGGAAPLAVLLFTTRELLGWAT